MATGTSRSAAFSVLLPKPGVLDAPRIARALSRFLGVPVHDAAVRARRSCGIVAEGLSEGQAKDLAKRLEEETLGGWVLRDDALATVPSPEPVRALDFIAAGFRPSSDGSSLAELVPSRAIRLLAAASIEKALIIDVILESPLRRLRVNAERFDFRCLGGRMNYDARNNVRELVRSLSKLSPAALRARGAELLVRDHRSEPLGYDSVEDLEREERWLLTIA